MNPNRNLIEIVGVYALILLALWTSQYSAVFAIAAIIWILIGTFVRHPLAELGVGSTGFRKSAWVAISGAGLAVVIVAIAALSGTLHAFPWLPRPWLHSGVYVVWALVQQFIAQSFFFVRFERLLRSGPRAVVATGLLFGVAHLPNPVLLVATAVMGLALTEVFRRHRNVYTLGLAHALLGIAVAMAVPNGLHHGMNVGLAYLTYPAAQ